MLTRYYKIINFVIFQAAWFACVLGAANSMPYLGPIVVLFSLALTQKVVANPKQEFVFIFCAALLGAAVDILLVSLGLISFTGANTLFYPLWMFSLWVCFAGTLSGCMSWINKKYLLASFFGLIGGPLSYYAGAQLGAIVLAERLNFSLVAVGIEWALVMPIILWLRARFQSSSS